MKMKLRSPNRKPFPQKALLFFITVMMFSFSVFALNGRTSYQAKIVKPNGYPLEAASVHFRFTVLDPSASCEIYIEDYTSVNMIDSGGLIAFTLGTGARSFPTSGTANTFFEIFDNARPSFSCKTPGIYNPNPTDSRRIVMQFNDGSGWQTLPAMAINAVPYAMYASKATDAKTLNNKSDTEFVEYASLATLNCSTDEALHFNGVSFSCLPVGSSLVTLSGDISGNSNATSVDRIKGVSVTVTGLAANHILQFDGSSYVNKNIPTCLANQYMTYDGSSWSCATDSGSAGTITTINVTAPISSTGGTNPTISIAQASPTTDGYLSAADFTLFNNKLNATSAAIVTALGYEPVASGSIVSSQWITSGTAISYTGGNVGIGTNNPIATLDISKSGSSANMNLTTDTTAAVIRGRRSFGTLASPSSVNTVGANTLFLSGQAYGNSDFLEIASIAFQTGGEITDSSAPGIISFNTVASGSTTRTERMRVDSSGNVGIGTATPSARLQIAAGSSTRAPFKLTSGTLLSSPQSGTVEYDGNQLYFTDGTNTRRALASTTSPGSFDSTNSISNSSGDITITPNSGSGNVNVNGGLVVSSSISTSSNLNVSGSILSSGNIQGTSITATSGITTPVINGTSNLLLNPVSGNVGIGTSTPSTKLDVGGDINIANNSAIRSAGRQLLLMGLSGTTYLDSNGPGTAIRFQPNGNVAMTLTASGNVGVGTTVPSEKLQVSGKILANNGSQLFIDANASATILANTTSIPLTFQTNSTERLRIDPTGNVGIGITNPTDKLHIRNGSIFLQETSDSIVRGLYLTPSDNSRRNYFQALGSATATSDYLEVGSHFGSIHLTTGAATSPIPRLTVLNSGNVGIGTSSPSVKMQVSGSVIIGSQSTSNIGVSALNVFGDGTQIMNIASNGNNGTGIRFAGAGDRGGIFGDATYDIRIEPNREFDLGNIILKAKNGTSNVGIGISSPNARLQITSGTSAVAAVKLTSGTLLTTPQAGAVEYDGNNFYVTDGTNTRRSIATVQNQGSFDNTNTISNSSGNITLAPNNSTGSVVVSATTASADSTTGALVVKGGAGISGNLNVSGSILTSGNIQGSSITATSGITTPVINGTSNLLLNPLSGNVGIGTASPDGKLTINSSINSVAIRLSTSGTAVMDVYDDSTSVRFNGRAGLARDLSFWTSDVEKMRITSSGNVGIGTSSPTTQLELRTPSAVANSTYLPLKLTNTVGGLQDGGGSGVGISFAPDLPKGAIFYERRGSHGRGDFHFLQNTTADTTATTLLDSVMTIKNNGNVGIRTTNPAGLLDVSGTLGRVTIPTQGDTIAYSKNGINYLTAAGPSGSIQFQTGGLNNRVRIDENGNVGIGTSTPNVKLDIRNLGAEAIVSVSGTESALRLSTTNGSGQSWQLRAGDNLTNTNFRIYDQTNGTDRLTINSAGNVGIGTTTPTEKLEVNGQIKDAHGIINPSGAERSWVITSSGGTTAYFLGYLRKNSSVDGGISFVLSFPYDYGASRTGEVRGRFSQRAGSASGAWHKFGSFDSEPVYMQLVDTGSENLEVWAFDTDFAQSHIKAVVRDGADWASNGIVPSSTAPVGTVIYDTRNVGSDSFLIGGNVAIGTNSPIAQFDITVPYNLSQTNTYPNGQNTSGFILRGNETNPFGMYMGLIGAASSTNRVGLIQTTTANTNNDGTIALQPNGGGVAIGALVSPIPLNVVGTGSASEASSIAGFNGLAGHPSTNLYGISIGKTGTNHLLMGINKNSITGSVPASSLFISTWTGTGTLSLGRGGSNSLPSTSDLFIASNGNVGVGTTTPNHKLQINGRMSAGIAGVTQGGISIFPGNAGSWFHVDNKNDNTLRISTGNNPGDADIITFNSNGNVGIGTTTPGYKLDVQGGGVNSSGGYTQVSDITMKTNLQYISSNEALEKISSLSGIYYDWKDQNQFGSDRQIGLIAQQVEKVFPEATKKNKDTGLLSVSYSNLVAPMIESIKELYRLVLDNKNSIDDQSRTVASLIEKNQQIEKENQQIKEKAMQIERANMKMQMENQALKAYLCAKDPGAPICE